MSEPYRPSNGTEGCCFYAAWCEKCQRDKPMSEGKNFDDCDEGETCQIIADTLAYDVSDPKYPKEWTYDDKGIPCCTKFLHVNAEPERERCKHTADMFDAPMDS